MPKPLKDICSYYERPKGIAAMKGRGIGLAISQKEGADYTSIVSGEVFYVDNAPKIFGIIPLTNHR